jgi:23S rRNA (cytosine1962-C5)-methyltransferase
MREKLIMFENRLTRVNRHISRQASRLGVTCYRIYDHDLPEFPLCIDRYEQRLHIAEYRRRHGMDEEGHARWMKDSLQVIAEVLQTSRSDMFYKERKRKSSRLEQYEKQASLGNYFEVKEAGLDFRVNLSDYLDTGLFLDHRITRSLVKAAASGKRVLNLFCYTGAFTVYALSGGAALVDSVDLSNTYLGWAEENLKINHLSGGGAHRFIRTDVMRYLPDIPKASYDLIILDPPTFSNSKGMVASMDVQQDHAVLINQSLRLLSPGGTLYFSTNKSDFILQRDQIQATTITDITAETIPFDFSKKQPHYCFLIFK